MDVRPAKIQINLDIYEVNLKTLLYPRLCHNDLLYKEVIV